jgi:dTDP-4-amino-4,6-dideoxygalactose transaminase
LSLQLSAGQFLKKLAWYTPAETYIPLHAILKALFNSSGNFEKTLCKYLGVEQCVLANSGRALLYLLLKTLKKKDGGIRDEVLIPGYTCYSVAASVAKAGLKIRIYDLDPATLQPDFNSLRKSTSEKTLAIIFQHLFGIPTPADEFEEISQKTGTPLIEDAAQALGGRIGSHRLGTIGDFSIFSFGRGKPLPVGGGGALIGKDVNVLSELELKLSNKGYISLISTAITQMLSSPWLYWIPEMLPLGLGETIFNPHFNVSSMQPVMQNLAENSMGTIVEIPLKNGNLCSSSSRRPRTLSRGRRSASSGSTTGPPEADRGLKFEPDTEIGHKVPFSKGLDDLNTHRHAIANTYEDAFDNACFIPVSEGRSPVYTRFPLMAGSRPIPKGLRRFGVRRMYPRAIADEETIKPYLANQEVSTPGASEIAQNLITLPTHKHITENLAKEIARKVNEIRIKETERN